MRRRADSQQLSSAASPLLCPSQHMQHSGRNAAARRGAPGSGYPASSHACSEAPGHRAATSVVPRFCQCCAMNSAHASAQAPAQQQRAPQQESARDWQPYQPQAQSAQPQQPQAWPREGSGMQPHEVQAQTAAAAPQHDAGLPGWQVLRTPAIGDLQRWCQHKVWCSVSGAVCRDTCKIRCVEL